MLAEGTPFMPTAVRTYGSGALAERLAMETLDRIKSNRGPQRKYKGLLGPRVGSMGPALARFCEVANQMDDDRVRVLALEYEFICDALRISFTP